MNWLKKLWRSLAAAWNYTPSEEDKKVLIRAELELLYNRCFYLESLLKVEEESSIDELTKRRQNSCKHLKGGRLRITKDYALRHFIFIDGRHEIACLICGKKWHPGDLDWERAINMWEQTTNTRSSSEVLPAISPNRIVEKKPHTQHEINEAYSQTRIDDESIIRGRK
jgi:hypothetical protein